MMPHWDGPDARGYRCDHSKPVRFQDPEFGLVDLCLVPTCMLDQHFFRASAWDDEKFEQYAAALIHCTSSLGGVITIDWHTYTIADAGCPGWWRRLGQFLDIASTSKPYLGGILDVIQRFA